MRPLGWADPLPARPRRVLVAGCSGAGKTTLARALGAALGLPVTELDALHHGPGWVPRPEFADDVAALAARAEWVTEWQYSAVRAVLLARANLLAWLDLSRTTVMAQLVPRTVGRRLRRTELWNGNVEPPLRTLFSDPDHILRWAWRTHPRTADRVRAVLAVPTPPVVVRLRSRREVRGWLAGPVAALRRGTSTSVGAADPAAHPPGAKRASMDAMPGPIVPAVFHVRRARDLIDRHYAEPLDLDAMAQAAGFSRYHFARAFREAYGEPPGAYLSRRRVERAQDLLRSANLTVTEVCHLVGFTSLGSFSSRFTALVGMSPSEYRRRHVANGGPPAIPGCFAKAWGGPRVGSAIREKPADTPPS